MHGLGKEIAISDFTQVSDDAGGPTPAINTDGVHPTAVGYRQLASSSLYVILSLRHPEGLIVCIVDNLTSGSRFVPRIMIPIRHALLSWSGWPMSLQS